METRLSDLIDEICCQKCSVNPQTLEEVIVLAVEIAREGREGRKIGTIFVVGDEDEVSRRSRSLILDPLLGHPDDVKRIGKPDMRETIKELAQLDGGFIVSEEGVVLSGARYFNASLEGIDLPLGLGSRHMAGASISLNTHAVAVVVSESSVVRIFNDGALISEIIPELWMMRRDGNALRGRGRAHHAEDATIVGSNG